MLSFIQDNLLPGGFSFGPLGSSVILILNLVLGIIVYRQRAWRSTAEAAVVEKNIHKDTADRLRARETELQAEVRTLSAQRDLTPLSATLAAWIIEGKARFDGTDKSLQANTEALKSLMVEMRAQRQTSEESYRGLQAAFIAHTLDDKATQLEAALARARLASVLEALESKLHMTIETAGVK